MQDQPVVEADGSIGAGRIRCRRRRQTLETPSEVVRQRSDGRPREKTVGAARRLEPPERGIELGERIGRGVSDQLERIPSGDQPSGGFVVRT